MPKILSLIFFLIPRPIKKLYDTGNTGTPIANYWWWLDLLPCVQ